MYRVWIMSKLKIRLNVPLDWNDENIALVIMIVVSYALFGLAAWLVLPR